MMKILLTFHIIVKREEVKDMIILEKHSVEETSKRMEVKIEHFNPEACDCYCCNGD